MDNSLAFNIPIFFYCNKVTEQETIFFNMSNGGNMKTKAIFTDLLYN